MKLLTWKDFGWNSYSKVANFSSGTFYRPPNSSNYYDKDFVLKLDNILDGAVSLGQDVIENTPLRELDKIPLLQKSRHW